MALDTKTFYTKKIVLHGIMTLHDVDIISLHTNMTQYYYVQVDGIPQYYIDMMEDAQKKAKQAGMPNADIELVYMCFLWYLW